MVNDTAKNHTTSKSKIVCREILDGDIEAVATLLARGFSSRTRDYWLRGLKREQVREIPDGYPRYGYMLEHEGRAVGVLLVLYAQTLRYGQPAVMCNVGSWYVDEAFRGQGPRLVRSALSREDVIYTDTTPSVPTYSFVERIGFKRYCSGLFFSLPLLARVNPDIRTEIVAPDSTTVSGLPAAEAELLVTHARYGCLSIVCRTPQGPEPFILLPFRIRQGKIALPAMQLIYCRNIESYKRCAHAIGREVLWRGRPVVILDANGAVDGLFGIYTEKRGRKYFRGPHTPALADLTNTEPVLFGL
jgi:hypothetical protein